MKLYKQNCKFTILFLNEKIMKRKIFVYYTFILAEDLKQLTS